MSYEDYLGRKIDKARNQERRERPQNHVIEQAHAKAKELLANSDYVIQETRFMDLYGQQNVMNDMLRVKQKRQLFEKEQTPDMREAQKTSDVFEAIMMQHTELSNWLGENVSVTKTSLYDDYFNGTDMIAEWKDSDRESNVLALAVDVTFGKASVERKFERIRRDVRSGRLGTIKYFKSSDDSIRGERKGVPHAVVGVDKQTVEELAQLWVRNDTKALGSHPIQRAIVEELCEQLDAIRAYAFGCGQTRVADAYRRSLTIVQGIREEKAGLPLGRLEHDRVYGEIMSRSRSVFRA